MEITTEYLHFLKNRCETKLKMLKALVEQNCWHTINLLSLEEVLKISRGLDLTDSELEEYYQEINTGEDTAKLLRENPTIYYRIFLIKFPVMLRELV